MQDVRQGVGQTINNLTVSGASDPTGKSIPLQHTLMWILGI